ncbi:cAMP receptor protein [bacterium BMS3Bbin10]|nr:cAMP receptor protein [bacterium BMS3Bbin10]
MREYTIGAPLGLEAIIPAHLVDRMSAAGAQKSFAKGEVIYRQGEPANHIHLLLSGRARTILTGPQGQEALLRIHLPHNILGLTALASKPVRDADAIATEPAVTSMIARARLLALMRDEPQLAEHLLELLVNRMTDFHYRVGEMASQSVEQRLARALLALSQPDPAARDDGKRHEITLTHEDLANLLNTRRPTISAAINRFAEAGLIRKSGRNLAIADADALARLYAGPPRTASA